MIDIDNRPLTLDTIQAGQSVVVTKVKGHGAFRKRITEMGFVSGKTVTMIKQAPLQDPVEYKLMGSRVMLRRSEAAQIEIAQIDSSAADNSSSYEGTIDQSTLKVGAGKKGKVVNVALVGNPNCGKTTLFNYTTGKQERVGNYGGVTVDIKTSKMVVGDYTINITDLPGTYSLSEYTPEELFVREHLTESLPDIVINVVDASNLERNLYLTTQLIDMNIKVIMALNIYDELEKSGDKFDHNRFGKLVGIPIIPTISKKGFGLDTLIEKAIEVYEDKDPILRHIHINYGAELTKSIYRIRDKVEQNQRLSDKFYPGFTSIKLLEQDKKFSDKVAEFDNSQEIIDIAKEESDRIGNVFSERPETVISDAKYGFIHGALKNTYKVSTDPKEETKQIDSILTNRYLGFPIFLGLMWLMFQLTFSLGGYPMDWIDMGIEKLGSLVSNSMNPGPLKDLIVDGIIGGCGGVLVFLPNILILFFCISFMEDSGYMARAAFIMDKLMHKIGLHGKSFIPLLMGFGCNVPAVMATRTLESRRDRIITMLITPFMSCSARLPVYMILISAFFAENQAAVLMSIYAVGVLLAIGSGMLLKTLFFKKEEVPFVMELPPYRMPTLRNSLNHMWSKSVQYISKMGTVILAASIIIWALGYFPTDDDLDNKLTNEIEIIESSDLPLDQQKSQINTLEYEYQTARLENSYIGQLGHAIEPVIAPLGFDWKIGVSILAGLPAKEIVVGTMGVLYQSSEEDQIQLQNRIKEQKFNSGDRAGENVFTPLVAYVMMLFVLIYFPCVAVLAAIKREAGLKWAIFTVVYTTSVAWIVSYIVYNVGMLF